MHFYCECGHRITDTTDYLPYKAHLISDQDWFDFLDEIDSTIKKLNVTDEDKEKALNKISTLATDLTKLVYQCRNCGNVFFETESSKLEKFKGCNQDVNKKLLQSARGDKWPGFLYGEWLDNKPVWSESNGYIWVEGIIETRQYNCWETLEKEYYSIFNELTNRNVLRSGRLKKNNELLHSWSSKP